MDVYKSALNKRFSGFTLIELLVVVAILAILLAIAYPSFESSIQNSRLNRQTNQLVSALQFARSEARSSGLDVTVCSSTDQTTCNADDDASWRNGYIIRKDSAVLKTYDAMETGLLVNSYQPIVFSKDGTPSSSHQMTLCDNRGIASARGIILNASGQVRTGAPLACQ